MSGAGTSMSGSANSMSGAAVLRSFLFVPGDSERKQIKALGSGADALILDLEDSVSAAQLPAARARVRELLQAHPYRTRQQLWVRVSPLSGGALLQDLAAVFAGSPDGLVLPKVSSPAELEEIGHYLSALEVQQERAPGTTRLLVIATETPQAVLTLGTYGGMLTQSTRKRLAGLTWGAEDLSAALGSAQKTDSQGALTFTFQLARSLCLLTASSMGVEAVDGVSVDFRNIEGLRRDIEVARRDGFTGKLAIHPDQVGPINEAFVPAAAEVEWAKKVVAAFAASPGAGVTSLDGRMIDKPHLVQARRILERSTAGRAS